MAKVQDFRGEYPLVDPETGLASPEFLRFLQERGVNVTDLDDQVALALANAATALSTANTAQTEVDALEAVVAALDLDDLTDVDTATTPPTDGQALIWDDASSLWIPGDVASGGGGGGGGAPIGALIYHNTTQSTPAFTDNYLDLNTTLYEDVAGIVTGTAPGELTVPSGYTRCRISIGGFLKTDQQIGIQRDSGSGFGEAIGLTRQGESNAGDAYLSAASAIIPCEAGHKFRFYNRGTSGTIAADVWMAIELWPSSGGGSSGPTIVRPAAADFTQLTKSNGSETITIADNTYSTGVHLTYAPGATSNRGGFIGMPVTPGVSFTATARVAMDLRDNNWRVLGLALQGTDANDLVCWGYYEDNGDAAPRFANLNYIEMSSNTGGGTTVSSGGANLYRPGSSGWQWLRIVYDQPTDTAYFEFSADGEAWFRHRGVVLATVLAGLPTLYAGFGFYSTGSTTNQDNIICDHFSIEYT